MNSDKSHRGLRTPATERLSVSGDKTPGHSSDQEDSSSGLTRAFIALEISPEVRSALASVQEELRRTGVKVKWTDPAIIHLTLAFLGSVTPDESSVAAQMLDSVAGKCPPFTVTISRIGFFGSARSPRIVWAGVNTCPELVALQESIYGELRALGITFDDKPFKPHITIGRIKPPWGAGVLLKRIETLAETSFGNTRVDRLFLFKSDLRPAGPIHTALHSAQLRAAQAKPGSRDDKTTDQHG